jgi:DNA-binding MarR family transcriptional regulator
MVDSGPDARLLLQHVRALVRRFAISERADVFCCGMTIAQAATLETLRLEGPLRMGELGRRLGITPSTLTRNLQRLLDTGYVKRQADGTDGRAAVVALTASGRRQADKLESQEEWFAGEILERIDPEHRAAVIARMADLLIAVRAATKSCCPEGAFDHLMTGFPAGDARLREAPTQTRCGDDGCCQ